MFRTRAVQSVRKEQHDTALTKPFRCESFVRHAGPKRSRMLNLLSAEEMKVSIITCAPLKKSPNFVKGKVSEAESAFDIYTLPALPRWVGWSDAPN